MPDDQKQTQNDKYALSTAAFFKDLAACKELIAQGHDINQLNEYGETPLITAVDDCDDVDWIAELLDLGANIDACDEDGDTALQVAEFKEHNKVAEFLLERGATAIPGTSQRQQTEDAVYEFWAERRNRFLDDRMYVLEISRLTPISAGLFPDPHTSPGKWSVITRRNCPGYPPTRTDDFDAYEDAVEYLKKVAPETPRVSLGKRCPNPPPSWDEFQAWLEASNLPRMPY